MSRLPLVAAAGAIALLLTSFPAAEAATKRANLRIDKTTTVSFASSPGGTVKVDARTHNAGKKKAGASWTGLLLSRNGTIGAGDIRLDREKIGPLKPGKKVTDRLSGKIPANLATGSWRLIVCADIHGHVKESNNNNCTTWKTFTRNAPPAPTEGPNGGAASVCSGSLKRVPYSNGTYAQPLQGVHFSVSPSTSSTIPFEAAPVGVEWDYMNEDAPPYEVVTITNDGTQPVTGISDIQSYACQLDNSKPDHWGNFSSVIRTSSTGYPGIELANPCGGSIAVGASCEVLLTISDPTTRGGDALPAYLLISVQVAGTDQHDIVAYFPIGVGSTSQGYWGGFETQTGSDSFSNAPAGSRRYRYYTVTNVGDRDALPVFRVEEDPGTPDGGIRVDSPDGWNAPSGYPTKCATVLYDAIHDVYAPATAPGGSCTIRISACSSQGSRNWSAELVARHPATDAQRSSRVGVTYTTSPGDAGSC